MKEKSMGSILRLNFLGETIDREDFLDAVKEELFSFVEVATPYSDVFLVMILEMIKNIYDHSENKGHAHFIKTVSGITFEIANNTNHPFDYPKYLYIGASSKNTKENNGIGLGTIHDLSNQLGITLEITQQNGLCYKGTWNPSG